jgi:heavy metal translocating P-type ATPase
MQKIIHIIKIFAIPFVVLVGIIGYVFFQFYMQMPLVSLIIIGIAIFLGSIDLIKDTATSLIHKEFALDYIALLAITVALISQQYLVAAIIVLMLSGGNTLEDYGMQLAKQSLTALTDRIPAEVIIWDEKETHQKIKIEEVKVGQIILIRKGEVIPLDGNLVSEKGQVDESSLTGEPYIVDKFSGDYLRSGTVNTGNVIKLKVEHPDSESTYRKIVEMVKQAQKQKAPLIRLADRYSTIFTIITLVIASATYLITRNAETVLAVLVIATPCPLILATPIALMGGMNKAAKKRIITKNLGSIEVLSRVQTIIFDKTGTITLGKPTVTNLKIIDQNYSEKEVYTIAEAIERNSLHPLAKAIVDAAHKANAPRELAKDVHEEIGKGITGIIKDKKYTLAKAKSESGMTLELTTEDKLIALFTLEDEIKQDSKSIMNTLKEMGLNLMIFTGDKKENAQKVMEHLNIQAEIKAECTPESKKEGIQQLQKDKKVVAMVGDGINDAPALATADVGMVFSNQEHTAASEAADVVFLGGDLSSVLEVLQISKRTIYIALQSILIGIGISTIGMLLAAFGFISPIWGAFTQEAIDIFVILNALRTSR